MSEDPEERLLDLPVRGRAARVPPAARIELPPYLPARMLNEFVYCPRLFFYEWVEGVLVQSADTVDGTYRHTRVDSREDELPPPDALEGGEAVRARSVSLSSDSHGLIAKIDVIEAEDGLVTPIYYKRGAPRTTDEGPEAWPADTVQICSQALILREHGYRVQEGIVYYHQTKQRVRILIDDGLVGQTVEALAAAQRLARTGRIPPPLVDSPKCPRCSLVGVCLPDETRRAMFVRAGDTGEPDQLVLFDTSEDDGASMLAPGAELPDEVRRLVPARDDLRPLYVTGFGLTVGKKDQVLEIREKGKRVQEVRLGEISQLNAFGAVTVTGGALQALCQSGIAVAHFSSGGWFAGLTQGLGLKNVFLRIAQFRRADDVAFCLGLATDLVATKVRNQRVLLQRNHVEPGKAVLERLKHFANRAARASSIEELLGIEGSAARLYFEQFAGMLKVDGTGDWLAFEFARRNRRPPRDPVNALLSFAYSLLVKDLTIVCHAVGFDPFVGFYHQPRFGRPALALDLMEGFRALIADSVVVTAINTRMVTPLDFIQAGRAVSLTPRGRKGLIRAYEQRMDHLVTHPLFGYRVSYRRVLEVQARLLGRVVSGEIGRFPGFETR